MRSALFALIAGIAIGVTQASAQERLMFPDREDVRAEIIRKINAETVRIDISTWYLTERTITNALINRWRAGVPVRLLGDRVSIFEADPRTRTEYEYVANAGIPIRLRYNPTSFPSINHWKAGIFVGQGIVEFGSANWTPFELWPASATNFKDETALFTDDAALVDAFKTRFDEFWADTTYFLDWPVAYERETGQPWSGPPMVIDRTRLVNPPAATDVPGMVWSQGAELNDAMSAAIRKETNGVTIVVYRLSVPTITDALLNRLSAGVPVRVLVEPTQYRQSLWPEYWLTGARIDQLWVAGAQIKQRTHDGLTHMKVLITSESAMQGSSNFTKNWQRDHNYFIPAAQKPVLYAQLRDKIEEIWNNTTYYTDFSPKPPSAATLSSPANGFTNVATTPTFRWNRAQWAVAYDVYVGTTMNNMTFQARVNAQLVEEPPLTYSWTPSTPLLAGTTYYWKVVSRTFATNVDSRLIATSATASFTTTGTSGGGGGSGPYGGTPVSLPGTIQAENFDEGDPGVAYHDTTTGNSGGKYRTTNVDIETTGDSTGAFNVGWTAAGEWLNYTVNVGTAGAYDLDFRVASNGGGGTFHLEVNGVDKTGPLSIPNSGGWQRWVTVAKSGVNLAAGRQTWRLVIDSAGPTGAVANVNYITVKTAGSPPPPPPTGSTPFGGTPASIPGRVESENFDEGGQAVAYQDATAGNSGGKYRTTDVDVESTTDTGGGFDVGWTSVGEWLKYTVNVTTAGTYDIDVRVAANGTGGTFHIEVDGVDKTGPLSIPNTGGWQRWTTVTKAGVSLSAGQQVWRLVIDGAGPTGVIGNFNYVDVLTAGAPPPPPPTASEIVIYANDVPDGSVNGNWAKALDPEAAGGVKLMSINGGAATVSTPRSSPTDFFDVTFNAVAGVRYRLWLRINAEANDKYNDSLYVQFSGSVNGAGSPIYRIGTTQGLNVNQATCSTCAPAGWGWHNSAYWLPDTGEVWFNATGPQTLRVQIREDGVRLDQIVLSPSTYLTTRPGSQTNDTTIVPKP